MSRRPSPFDQFQRLFDQYVDQFTEQFADQFAEGFEATQRPWDETMRQLAGGFGESTGVDLVDEGDAFVVAVDLPGFERDDVDLRVVGDALQIDAERDHSVETEEGAFVRHERKHDAVRRRVQFPQPVVSEEASADLHNGVLTVTLPKAEPGGGGGRQIEIG